MKPSFVFILLIAACFGGTAVTQERPNVIFILSDDLGWSDTTLYGTTKFYETPNMERLAKRGMTFTRAYSASPLCSPTRSAILTGLSPARTGLTTPNCHLPDVVLEATTGKAAPPNKHAIAPIPVTRLRTDYPNLARSLKSAGYATGHFGKWHLGPEPFSPHEQGFDVDIPHWPGPGPAGSFVAPWKYSDFKENTPGEHIEDRMAAEAVAWMEKVKESPFYLNYWQFSVHAPFDAKQELIEKHRARVNPADPQRSPTYAAMVESMDDSVGTLLDAVDRLGLADRTIFVFTSDNGGNMYNEIDGTTPTSNTPLRGGKATMFEGGTRVPCVIAWPGITAPGSRSDEIIQSEDFYPTLLAGLGIELEKEQVFDGIDILPALRGGELEREAVFQYFPHDPGVPDWLPPSVAVRRGDWKLIRIFHAGENGAHRHLLFHLKDDPGEKNNLAPTKTALVAEMDELIGSFLLRTGAVVPVPNPKFDPALYRPELEGVPTSRKAAGKAKGKPAAAKGTWQGSKDTRIETGAGGLVITSSGGDPWISTSIPGKGITGPATVKIRLSSTGKGNGLLYFAGAADKGYHLDRSVNRPLVHDGKEQLVEWKLPAGTFNRLRLDPGNAAGVITIKSFVVIDEAGKRHVFVGP